MCFTHPAEKNAVSHPNWQIVICSISVPPEYRPEATHRQTAAPAQCSRQLINPDLGYFPIAVPSHISIQESHANICLIPLELAKYLSTKLPLHT